MYNGSLHNFHVQNNFVFCRILSTKLYQWNLCLKYLCSHIFWNVPSSPLGKKDFCWRDYGVLLLWSSNPRLLRKYFRYWNPNIHLRAEGQLCASHLHSAVQLCTPLLMWFSEENHLHLLREAHFVTCKSLSELEVVPQKWHGGENLLISRSIFFDIINRNLFFVWCEIETESRKFSHWTQHACFSSGKLLHGHLLVWKLHVWTDIDIMLSQGDKFFHNTWIEEIYEIVKLVKAGFKR